MDGVPVVPVPVPPAGPLNGVLVVDLTRVLAGPFCTMVLSDLGARIVKVEHPEGGDDSRAIGPFIDGRSAYFASVNRAKESIALDLRSADDRRVLDALLERADVLIENFRPGAMERLGYGWSSVHERWPRLIYAAVSGFGHTGPYADRPAYDMVVQGMGGVMSITGWPGGPPTRVGTSIGDITAGLFTAIGVNAALYDRATTGTGRFVDVGMLDCQVAILENAIARYCSTGHSPGPLGARHPSIAPFGAMTTADGYLIAAAGNDALFAAMCAVVGRPELATDARFVTNDARSAHVDVLQIELEAAFVTRSTDEWLAALAGAGVPCGPINDVARVLADPQVLARTMVVDIAGEDGSGPGARLRLAGNPIKISGFPDPAIRGPVPVLDAHRAVLLAELGLSD